MGYDLKSVVEMKKQHPCGSNEWEIIRMGMDIRIKSLASGHSVLIPRRDFDKKIKKIIR